MKNITKNASNMLFLFLFLFFVAFMGSGRSMGVRVDRKRFLIWMLLWEAILEFIWSSSFASVPSLWLREVNSLA